MDCELHTFFKSCLSDICLGSAGAGKLRILCLHGYLQNAQVIHYLLSTAQSDMPFFDTDGMACMHCMQTFSNKIGSVRRALKSRAEMIFIDAPHLVASTTAEDMAGMGGSQEQSRGWFTWQVEADTASFAAPSSSCSLSLVACPTSGQLTQMHFFTSLAFHDISCTASLPQVQDMLL